MPLRKLGRRAAEVLAEETGKSKEEFEYDGEIPDPREQDSRIIGSPAEETE